MTKIYIYIYRERQKDIELESGKQGQKTRHMFLYRKRVNISKSHVTKVGDLKFGIFFVEYGVGTWSRHIGRDCGFRLNW